MRTANGTPLSSSPQQLVVASHAVLHTQLGRQNCQPVGSEPVREQQR